MLKRHVSWERLKNRKEGAALPDCHTDGGGEGKGISGEVEAKEGKQGKSEGGLD